MRLMFVCHGNICRSPMAEFMMKELLRQAGLEGAVFVTSSATSTEEIWNGIGNPVYPPAKRELLKHGITCDGKRAVQLQKSDYGIYDLFLCMDGNNVRNALRILGSDKDGKIKKLMSLAGEDRDVADPWYTDDFTTAYNDIYRGCEALLNLIIKEKKVKW